MRAKYAVVVLHVKMGLMSRKIVSMQIRVTDDLREHAKVVAKKKGLTLSVSLYCSFLPVPEIKSYKISLIKELERTAETRTTLG